MYVDIFLCTQWMFVWSHHIFWQGFEAWIWSSFFGYGCCAISSKVKTTTTTTTTNGLMHAKKVSKSLWQRWHLQFFCFCFCCCCCCFVFVLFLFFILFLFFVFLVNNNYERTARHAVIMSHPAGKGIPATYTCAFQKSDWRSKTLLRCLLACFDIYTHRSSSSVEATAINKLIVLSLLGGWHRKKTCGQFGGPWHESVDGCGLHRSFCKRNRCGVVSDSTAVHITFGFLEVAKS